MDTIPAVLRAHSVAEVLCYLVLHRCAACGLSALRPRGEVLPPDGEHADHRMYAACAKCLRDYPAHFSVDSVPPGDGRPHDGAISLAGPSEIIDLAGWITLYRFLVEESWREPDRREARRLAWEAGLCLDEALKFYPSGENMAPQAAFFSEAARVSYRSHPALYDRRVVLHHRRQAPVVSEAERRVYRGDWSFWRRHVQPRLHG